MSDKKPIIIFIVIVLLVMIGIYTEKILGFSHSEKETPHECIDQISVGTAAGNDNNIYCVKFPYYYLKCRYREKEDKGIVDLVDLDTVSDNVKKEYYKIMLNYLKKYASNEETSQIGDEMIWNITMSYYDENGEQQSIYVCGYREFPKDWAGFVKAFNDMCGSNLLTDSTELQKITPKFLAKVFGVTNKDIPVGTIQDFIHTREIQMADLWDTFYLDEEIQRYYYQINEDKMNQFRPYKLQSKESTTEEFEDFCKLYKRKLNESGITVTDMPNDNIDNNNIWKNYNTSKGTIEVAQTSRLKDFETKKVDYGDKNYYALYYDNGPEGESHYEDFYYNSDGKFLIVTYDVDAILIFQSITDY